ncbi:MAG TPA: PAS domain-containing sensor histidine kinase [bacterium]|nr:PAS domain-containing sensor histidine kinase [bacterium]
MNNMPNIEEEYAKVLDASPLIFWANDQNNQCIYGNKAGLDFLGRSFEELSGEQWLDFVHPEDLDGILKTTMIRLCSRPTQRDEFRARLKNGKWAWMLQIAAPRFNPAGTFLGYTGSLIDVTEQKSREEALKKKQSHLEAEIVKISEWERSRIGRDLHDSLTQMLLGISLKSMLLGRKLQKKDLPEFYTAQEVAREIDQAISATRKLSQSLFPVALTKMDFLDALRDMSEQVRTLLGAELRIGLPEGSQSYDPEVAIHLYRIVQEAVTNAIRHGRARRIEVAFRISGTGRNCLEIRDDGTGGDPKSRSSGLGLHIMEYRARAIGGEIEIGPGKKGFTVRCHYPAGGKPDEKA